MYFDSRLGGFKASREFGLIYSRSDARLCWCIYANVHAGSGVFLRQRKKRHGSVVRPLGSERVKKTRKSDVENIFKYETEKEKKRETQEDCWRRRKIKEDYWW